MRADAVAGAAPSVDPEHAAIRATIAVLPFTDYAGSGEIVGLGDVLTDQVISTLSRTVTLNVISWLSMHPFRGRPVFMDELIRLINPDFILSGRFFREGPRIALNIELVQTFEQRVIRTDHLEASVVDWVSVNGDLATRIAHTVAVATTSREPRRARMQVLPTGAVHTQYLVAVSMLHRHSLAAFERARHVLDDLLERAPRHAAPLALRACWHVFRVAHGWSNDDELDFRWALHFASRALDRDDGSALALTIAGSACAGMPGDPAIARAWCDQALAANPSEPLAWLFKGAAHGLLDEAGAALESSERALLLSPLDPMRFLYDSFGAGAAIVAGDYQRAVTLAQRAIRANRRHGCAYRALAIAQGMLGMMAESRRTIEKLLAVETRSSLEQFFSWPAADGGRNKHFGRILKAAGLPSAWRGYPF